MTNFIKTTILMVIFFVSRMVFSQGFVNLNFESATMLSTSQSYASNAIPGWTAYISGIPQTTIVYNSVPLSDPEVTLQGMNNGLYPVVQGNYFVMLWGQFNPGNYPDFDTNTAAIGQIGQIPQTAQSLTFWGNIGGMQATFNGQALDFTLTGNTANYNIYTVDISAYAGQTGQLLFTDAYYGNNYGGPGMLDNIQFSSSSVPETNVLVLIVFGTLLLGLSKIIQSASAAAQCPAIKPSINRSAAKTRRR